MKSGGIGSVVYVAVTLASVSERFVSREIAHFAVRTPDRREPPISERDKMPSERIYLYILFVCDSINHSFYGFALLPMLRYTGTSTASWKWRVLCVMDIGQPEGCERATTHISAPWPRANVELWLMVLHTCSF